MARKLNTISCPVRLSADCKAAVMAPIKPIVIVVSAANSKLLMITADQLSLA